MPPLPQKTPSEPLGSWCWHMATVVHARPASPASPVGVQWRRLCVYVCVCVTERASYSSSLHLPELFYLTTVVLAFHDWNYRWAFARSVFLFAAASVYTVNEKDEQKSSWHSNRGDNGPDKTSECFSGGTGRMQETFKSRTEMAFVALLPLWNRILLVSIRTACCVFKTCFSFSATGYFPPHTHFSLEKVCCIKYI